MVTFISLLLLYPRYPCFLLGQLGEQQMIFFPYFSLTRVAISYVHESRSTKIRLPPFPVYAQTTKEPKGLLDGLCPSLFPFEGFPSQKVFGDRNQLNWVLGQRVLGDPDLPVDKIESELREAFKSGRAPPIQGKTGSGKSYSVMN